MADKILNTRILLKYDTLANWEAKNTILNMGEVGFAAIDVDIPPVSNELNGTKTDRDGLKGKNSTILFKIGDGQTPWKQLNWANALAADVYGWAKEANLAISIEEVAGTNDGQYVNGLTWDATTHTLKPAMVSFDTVIDDNTKTSTNAPTTKAVKDYVDSVAESIVAQGTVVAEGAKIDVAQNGNTYTVSHETVAKPTETAGSGRKYLTGVDTDDYGHITGFTTAEEKDQDLSNYKTKQTAVEEKGAADKTLKISQDTNGVITATPIDIAIAPSQVTDFEASVKGVKVDNAVNADKAADADRLGGQAPTYYATATALANALAEAKKYADDNDANDNTEYHVEYDSANKKIKLVAGADASKMEIPTDDFIKDGMIQSVAISEDGKNLTITWNTDAGLDATNIPLSELVDVMTGVDGTTITVNVSADDKISAEIKTGVITDGHIATNAAIAKGKLSTDVQTSLEKADTAAQEADIAEALEAAKTDASNKDAVVLSEAQKYADSLAGNYATAEQGTKADNALQSVEVGTGLKVSEKANNKQTIEIDDSVVFVFNCGSATELID
jgi:hypothetical protein